LFLKIFTGVVLGLNLIKGMILPGIDMVGKSVAVKAINLLPGAKEFTSAGEVFLSTASVIKNAIGGAGIIVLFLILLVPRSNFKDENILRYMLLGILIVSIAGVLWSSYSEPSLMHSWRSKLNYMNPALQVEYLLNHPFAILNFLRMIFTFTLGITLNGLFNFFSAGSAYHYSDHYTFITILLWIFLAATLLFYPNKVKFNSKARWGSLIILLMIYVGTCFIQLLTWADVGKTNIGVSARYFLPLFALLPIIVPFRIGKLDKFKGSYDKYAMIFIKFYKCF
jgi:hypothetical protein